MDKNLVSVVIPAYNLPDYTRKTIQSVIDQTHRPIEIILSDDNSPISLKSLVDEKQPDCGPDLEIKYYRQKENLNYYFNLQFVLGEANGKYVVLLDHGLLCSCTFGRGTAGKPPGLCQWTLREGNNIDEVILPKDTAYIKSTS